MRNLALHWKIIIGMVLGVVFGLVAANLGWVEFTKNWIKPFGTIFINMLKLIAVPLIIASLIKGISNLKDISQLSKMGGKTIGIYLLSTTIAVIIGLTLVNVIQPGKSFTPEQQADLKAQYEQQAQSKQEAAQNVKDAGPLQPLVDMVPGNIISAMGNNRNMLQVIFFSIFFGVCLVLIDKEKAKPVIGFFDGLNDVILKMVDIIMLTAPVGVFALLAAIIVDFAGSMSIFAALGKYSLTVVLGLGLMMFLIYPIAIKFIAKIPIAHFFKSMAPAQLLAFSTSSSAATLPVTMERCEDELGVSEEVSSFVLPLGATINMDGTSLYQAVAAVFIAQVYGMDLAIGEQLTIVVMAVLASIGAAAVPGAGMVMLVAILEKLGIPLEGLALIFAVDRILDMCRTSINVTSDATVASIIAKTENALDPTRYLSQWEKVRS